jgi:hypothetical protein
MSLSTRQRTQPRVAYPHLGFFFDGEFVARLTFILHPFASAVCWINSLAARSPRSVVRTPVHVHKPFRWITPLTPTRGAGPAECSPSVSRNSVTTSLYRRLLLDAFEKAPASIAAIAISIATCADFTSTPVTNLASCSRLVVIIMGLPLARSTLARHFPGSRSKACTMNCLYSMVNDFDYRRYQYQRPRPCNATTAAIMTAASIMRMASFILPTGRAKHASRRHTGKKRPPSVESGPLVVSMSER